MEQNLLEAWDIVKMGGITVGLLGVVQAEAATVQSCASSQFPLNQDITWAERFGMGK